MSQLVNGFKQLTFAVASNVDVDVIHIPRLRWNGVALRILIGFIPESHPVIVSLALLHPHGRVDDEVLVGGGCDG